MWLQRDGATRHTDRKTLTVLYESILGPFWWPELAATVLRFTTYGLVSVESSEVSDICQQAHDYPNSEGGNWTPYHQNILVKPLLNVSPGEYVCANKAVAVIINKKIIN